MKFVKVKHSARAHITATRTQKQQKKTSSSFVASGYLLLGGCERCAQVG